MQRLSAPILAIVISLGAAAARADWVELANNDVVQGDVVSVDGEKVKLKSVNFGEMTIPRAKVRLIGLGDRPLPTAAQPAASPLGSPGSRQLSSQLPSLENSQMNQLLQQALGIGGTGDLQQQLNKTKEDLKKLQKDMGHTPEGDALNSYIQIFDLLGNLAPLANPPAPRTAPHPAQPTPQPQQPAPAKP